MSGGALSAARCFASFPQHARAIARQLFEALAFLHRPESFPTAMPVVHRDLKPDNILLLWPSPDYAEPPVVKISDFGLSRPLGNSNSQVSKCGTEDTMAPELMTAALWSAAPTAAEKTRIDIWSASVVLLQLLSGNTAAFTTKLLYREVRTGKLREFLTARGFQPAVVDLMHATLKPHPIDRPSAEQVLAFPYFQDL